jgi:hypothetical protein
VVEYWSFGGFPITPLLHHSIPLLRWFLPGRDAVGKKLRDNAGFSGYLLAGLELEQVASKISATVIDRRYSATVMDRHYKLPVRI